MIDQVATYSIDKFNEQINELKSYCAKDPDIGRFVDLLLTCYKYNSFDNTYFEKVVSDQLCDLMYDITKVDYRTMFTNPYHFKASWVYHLNSFIGNYFLDDFGFSIKNNSSAYNIWVASSATDDMFLQDPAILIEAAYDNAQFYFNVKNTNTTSLRTSLTGLKMKSSGKVEKMIYQYIDDLK